MHPQQPPNGPYQGGYPQQPPNGPYQGGYPQQPVPYGGHFPSGPVRMPGAAVAVRVLMFIGGGLGLLLAGLFGVLVATVSGGGEAGEGVLAGLRDSGLPLSADQAVLGLTLIAAIPFTYGVVSVLLASLLGRRSRGVLWSVVVFQGLAALSLVLNVLTGTFGSVIPLAFAVLMLVLMVREHTRAYYTRSAPAAY
ncbi:hypothetical protein [Nocardiopsis synnemataformans]|uniref:hypothetical protein n=1 Tax=Nocardiopsis synnemataformans TaxID=61305 RepID=UPI003EC0D294